ncbi:MAG: TlpA family protein disulfide reductase [Bacteroidota bacterium]
MAAAVGLVVTVSVPFALILLLHAETVEPLSIGQPAPSLQLFSLYDQTPISPAGNKKIILFFTVECPHCQNELLNFDALFRRYHKLMNFAAVSLSSSIKTKEFVRERGFPFPVAVDEEKTTKETYRFTSVPALFLIDKQGILRYRRFGKASLQVDEELVVAFLSGTTMMNRR